jgi:hypothetical protein
MRISLRHPCHALVGLVALIGALSPLACSGSTEPVNGGETTGEDQSLLKEGACIDESLGGATSCKAPEVWKKYVTDSCESRGLNVGSFNLGNECKGGNEAVKYSCCKPAPKPIPPKPYPNPGPACFGDAQGGPTSCKPAEVWTKYASDLCIAKGFQISHIGFAEACGDKSDPSGTGSFRWAKYECCDGSSPPPPPPPPPVCKTVELGDKTSCKPNGTWKEYAFDYCSQLKLTLTDISLGASCAPDSSQTAKVTCCDYSQPPQPPQPPPDPPKPTDPPPKPTDPPKPPPPPPPPPPQSCVGAGGTGACYDQATWKKIATDDCAKQGLTLTTLDFGGFCPNGGSDAKYTCCK